MSTQLHLPTAFATATINSPFWNTIDNNRCIGACELYCFVCATISSMRNLCANKTNKCVYKTIYLCPSKQRMLLGSTIALKYRNNATQCNSKTIAVVKPYKFIIMTKIYYFIWTNTIYSKIKLQHTYRYYHKWYTLQYMQSLC